MSPMTVVDWCHLWLWLADVTYDCGWLMSPMTVVGWCHLWLWLADVTYDCGYLQLHQFHEKDTIRSHIDGLVVYGVASFTYIYFYWMKIDTTVLCDWYGCFWSSFIHLHWENKKRCTVLHCYLGYITRSFPSSTCISRKRGEALLLRWKVFSSPQNSVKHDIFTIRVNLCIINSITVILL